MGHCKTISAAMVAPAFLLISFLLAGQSSAQWNYPPTRTVDVSDTYFGKTYADPISLAGEHKGQGGGGLVQSAGNCY